MDGIILVDKPQNLTSHDVVSGVRNLIPGHKIGHFGTLDPLATGLLIIAVGKATRLFPFFSKQDKVYSGQLRLGFSTDTYDSSGKPVSPETKDIPGPAKIRVAMENFKGEISQLPPIYSAKKYKGKPLYKLARKNKKVPLKSARVMIYFFKLKKFHPPRVDFELGCSSGTYIRSLVHDLGQILGCGAHLTRLTRISSGNFKLSDSLTPTRIKELAQKGKCKDFIIPLESLLPDLPKIILNEEGTRRAKNGNKIFLEDIKKMFFPESSSLSSLQEEIVFRLFSLDGKLIGFAKKEKSLSSLLPFLILG